MDPQIMDLCRLTPRFAYEAYQFVCEAVTFTVNRLDGGEAESGEPGDECEGGTKPDRHVSGAELLQGTCDLAVREFGMMAPVVFKHWGIRVTDDVGTIVFNLIEAKLLSKSDRDNPEDFHDLFDLRRALTEGFKLTIDDAHTVRRGDR